MQKTKVLPSGYKMLSSKELLSSDVSKTNVTPLLNSAETGVG